jgi:hypothetical protein
LHLSLETTISPNGFGAASFVSSACSDSDVDEEQSRFGLAKPYKLCVNATVSLRDADS